MIQNTPDVLKDEYPQKACRAVYSDILGTIENELTVMEFVPNVEVDDRTFILEYPPGTHVSDRVLGISYIGRLSAIRVAAWPMRKIFP